MDIKLKTYADISPSALLHNYRAIRTHTEKNALGHWPMVICVVKADAYGHGVREVAPLLGQAGCRFFAVSSEEEAAELRAIELTQGRTPEILILGYTFPENAAAMAELGVTCTAVSYEHAKLLAQAASKAHTRLSIHVKLDTGMNRVGFSAHPEDAAQTVEEIAALSTEEHLSLRGLFTHFACADDDLLTPGVLWTEQMDSHRLPPPDSMTARQLHRYENVLCRLRERGVNPGLCHTANSAAAIACPPAYFDAVRAGIILYGMFPSGEVNGMFRPVMRFASTIGHIHRLRAGESVSYGAVFTAAYDMTVATVTAGYADGYLRRYTGAEVTVNGEKFRQIGRICMDQCMIDITGRENAVHPGDEAVLFGGDNGESLEALAARAGTINYECTCAVSKRVTRRLSK